MAGSKHHTIPRFLQKGFASRIERSKKKEKVFVIQYLKDANEGREESTRNTMASRYYYGRGETSADDGMTQFENSFLTPRIRALRDGSSISNREIAELVAHFSIRPKPIRETFTAISKEFLEKMGGLVADAAMWGKAFEQMPSDFLAGIFQDRLSKIDPDSEDGRRLKSMENEGFNLAKLGELAADLGTSTMEDAVSREAMSSIASSVLADALRIDDSILEASIKDGHVRSIKDHVAPDKRVEVFEGFNWEIQNCDFDLILGDSGVLYISREVQKIVPFCDLNDIIAVFLPISSNQLLRGFRTAGERMERFSAEVNAEIASCSHDEFIASSENGGLDQLIPLIRSHGSSLSTAAELNTAIEDIRRSLLDGTAFSRDEYGKY